MHEYIRICHLGLSENDAKAIKSMFMLVPGLKNKYRFSGSNAELNAYIVRNADVVIINGDTKGVEAMWPAISRINRSAVPIVIHANGNPINGALELCRPIKVQKLVDILEEVDNDITVNSRTRLKAAPKLNILVVDDNYPVRKYMEINLGKLIDAPILISFAANGDEAIDNFQKRDYDLVFLDVVMPGVDGYKVCKALKALKKTRIVMLTSKKSPFDKLRGTLSGCDGYITKPPPDKRLSEEMRKSLKKKSKLIPGDFPRFEKI